MFHTKELTMLNKDYFNITHYIPRYLPTKWS